jgi:hypothetical protein
VFFLSFDCIDPVSTGCVQLDDGHHHGGATGVLTMSDHEATTKNGDSKVGDKKAKEKKKQFYSSCCDLVMKCSV